MLSILSILLALAAPSLSKQRWRSQLRVAHDELSAALHYARATAIMRHGNVLVCPSRDGRQCSAETHWEHGWLVIAEHKVSGQLAPSPLRVGHNVPRVQITSSSGRYKVRFRPDGSAHGHNLTLTLSLCSAQLGGEGMKLVVSNAGRIRSESAAGAGCTTTKNYNG